MGHRARALRIEQRAEIIWRNWEVGMRNAEKY
jgi:hypothetical protein